MLICTVQKDTTKYALESMLDKSNLQDQKCKNWNEIVEVFKRNEEVSLRNI